MRTRKATGGGEVPQQAPQQAAPPVQQPPPAPVSSVARGTDGNILGCALAVGESSALCPSCTGKCPDEARLMAKLPPAAQLPSMSTAPSIASSAFAEPPISKPLPGAERAAQVSAVASPERAVHDAQGALDGTDEFVNVTWAEKTFCPVAFNPYKVGPFSASTRVRKGETIAQAMERLHTEIDLAARRIVAKETKGFFEDLGVACQISTTVQVPEGRR